MYCKRATLVTFNSLRNLSKVCKTRSLCCVESSKALPFARNLSTATERSDFYNANYMNSDDNSSDYSNYNQVNGFNGGMSDGFNAEGSRTSQQLHSGVYGQASLESMSGKFQQSSSGYGMLPGGLDSMSGQSQQSSSGFYGGQYGNLQQNSGGHYAGNTGIYQQSLHNAEIGQSEQSSSVYYGGQYGMPQQNSGGHYAGNTGTYQQSIHNVGIHKQNKSGVNYSNAGNHWQKWNESQNKGMVVSQVTKDFKQNEESVEFAEGNQSRNTIEELDGFCEEGKLKEAVELLGLLEQEHVQVDLPRYVMLMKACGENKALQEAKFVHEHLMRSMPHLEVKTHNNILEMYSNCGSMDDAFVVFDQMPKRNLTSWDIMISGLAKNGLEEDSIELFAEFKRSGLKPDGQMFIGVFSVCGVLGDIVEGMLHFESMSKDYGIPASMEHYVSVVEMLGTAGCLDEALEFIEQMPIEPVVEIWETLMNFCRIHGHTVLGDRCAELVELLDPSRVNEQSRVGLIPIKASDLAGEKKKLSGQNPLDVWSRVYEYRAGDRSHPNHEKIYTLLGGLQKQMKDIGYMPETKFVLHDIDQETKEEALMAHSERLAAAQGFMNSPARSTLRIIKNLRVCGDCHNALKFISTIVGREIIARDAKRFHHFKDGLCSCKDYW